MWSKFKKFFSSMKIKHKVRFLFLAVLAVYVVALFLIFTFVLRKQVYQYALENNKKSMMSIGSNLTTEIEKVNNYSRLLLTKKEILGYLNGDPNENLSDYSNAVTGIYEIQNAYPEASSVFVFRNDNNYLTIGRGVTFLDKGTFYSEEWMSEINELDGGYVLRVNGDGVFRTSYESVVVSLIRNINDVDTLQKKGVLAVNFPLTVIEDTYRDSLGNGRHYAYLDHNQTIVCQDAESENFDRIEIGKNEFGEALEDGFLKKTIYCYYKVPKTSFTLLCYEEISLLENVSKEVLISLLFLIVLTGFVLFGIGIFISVYITTPIQKLVFSMDGVKDGWLRRVSIQHSDDEIGLLKDSYNDMLFQTNRLIEQLLQKEKSIRKAEIDILQEQIKPHFLYNTIEMIACLSIDGKREDVYDALETLGSFYRQFLSKGSNEVTLQTEIDISKDYLKIQKLRYGDIFDAVYELDESCMSVRLPKLILQPLVENCIYHGIRLKGERGIIRIRVFRDSEDTCIEVYDTGIGLTEEQLEHIMDDNNRSFGFKRTMERFQYYVGNNGSFKITSQEGKFTCILLRIGQVGAKSESGE